MNKILYGKRFFLLIFYVGLILISILSLKIVGIPLAATLLLALIAYLIENKKALKLPAYVSATISGLLGAIFFIIVFGVKVLDPTYTQWLYDNGDSAVKLVGWNFFRNEPWHMPIGLITDYGTLIPTSIMFADAIPILAVFFKLFNEYLPIDFQYLGGWMLFSYIMQGATGALLVRKVTDKLSLQILSSLFFVISPIMLFRGYLHHSLIVHWVFLCALLLLFNKSKLPAVKWFLLILFTLWVHPYIFFMVFVVFLVHLYMMIRYKKISIKFAAGLLGLLILIALLLLWLIGFFVIGDDGSTPNFGMYSMNLNSLFNPWGYSYFLKDRAIEVGQYEGFAYFGVGMLSLLALSGYLLLKNTAYLKIAKAWLALIVVCILFSIFAISNTIMFDNKIILHIPIGDYLTEKAGIFRASGRFFWLPYYLLVFVILSIIVKKNRIWISFLIIFSALFIQYFDFHKKFEDTRRYFYTQPYQWNNPLKSDFWSYATANYNKIIFLPMDFEQWLPFSDLAAKNKMKLVNNGYFSRVNWSKWNVEQQDLINNVQKGHVDKDAIYIINEGYLSSLKQVRFDIESKIIKVDGYNVLVPVKDISNQEMITQYENKMQLQNLAPSFFEWKVSKNDIVKGNNRIETTKISSDYALTEYEMNVVPGSKYFMSVDVSSTDTKGEGGVYIDIQNVMNDQSVHFVTGSKQVLNGKIELSYTVPLSYTSQNIVKIIIRIVIYKDIVGNFTFSNPIIYQLN